MADKKNAGVTLAAAALFAASPAAPADGQPVVPWASVLRALETTHFKEYLEHPDDRASTLEKLGERYTDCAAVRYRQGCVTGVGLVKELGLGPRTMGEIGLEVLPDGSVNLSNRHYIGNSVPMKENAGEKWRDSLKVNTGHAQKYEAATNGLFKASSFRGRGLYVVEALHIDTKGNITALDPNTYSLKPFGLTGEYAYQHTMGRYDVRPSEIKPAPAAKVYEHGRQDSMLIGSDSGLQPPNLPLFQGVPSESVPKPSRPKPSGGLSV